MRGSEESAALQSSTGNIAPERASTLWRVALLAIVLLAFGLRAYRLDFQSLWSDEGISLQRAQMALPEMLGAMPVEHMPGYFALLNGWVRVAGESDYALRFLSLWASVLAVALIYRLARDLGAGTNGHSLTMPVGVAAALLMATNAFQLWYAQEARMYSWLLAAALVSALALWRLVVRRGNGWLWGTLYAVATAWCVYLHLYGALVPLAQAIFVMGWSIATRDGRGFLRWLAASLAALVLFVPWLPRALGIFGFSGWRAAGDPAEIPWRYLAAFTAGDAMPEPWHGLLPWLYAFLALAGIVVWWRVRRAASLLLVIGVTLPMAGVLALALRNPDYHERYVIAVTAPLLLLVAGGLGIFDPGFWRKGSSRPGRWDGVVVVLLGLALAGANLLAVQRHYTDTSLHKPDFRGAAQTIMADLAPGDVVLVDGPDPSKVFLHYYTGTAPVIAVSDLEQETLANADGKLRALLGDAGRAWELLYFHAPATVQVWLATQAWATEPSYHNGIRVTLYGLDTGTGTTIPLDVDFGTALTLRDAALSTLEPAPGDLLRITTNWLTNEQAPEWKFSLRLEDAAGQPVQVIDYTPQNWFAPTNAWVVGQPARDQRGILLPADLAPGEYRLTLRLYDPATGAPVDTARGQDVELARLRIQP
ncbi:MAG: glycosyltransferase family 39 protein [Caldilinea sp.]|nr:glycosyltransferase family 39 protein [Caldilinea sp.]